MTEARAIYPGRLWIVGAAVLLALLLVCLLLRRGNVAAIGQRAVDKTQDASGSGTVALSAAEKARRAAIAALGPIHEKGINGADLYGEALALYAKLSDGDKAVLGRRYEKHDPAVDAALAARIEPIMELLRKARKAPYVDWGFEPVKPWTDVSERFKHEQSIANLALWDAGYQFQTDPDAAVSDLAAMEAFSRSQADSIQGLEVEREINGSGVRLLAENATIITADSAPDITAIVNASAVEGSYQAAMDNLAWNAGQLAAEYPKTPEGQAGVFDDLEKYDGVPADAVVPALEWMGKTATGLGATITETDAQYQQWRAQQRASTESQQFADAILGNCDNQRGEEQAAIVGGAMLQAGIAIEQGDQTQFQSIVDPVTGKPFGYTQTKTGFQLGSALQLNGGPVTLDFPAPAGK